jgi:ribonuclease-3
VNSPPAAGTDDELERVLAHDFDDPELLARALRHGSYAQETGEGPDNQRLEFLGDAVLDLVVAHLLYEAQPGWREGELTRARSALVNDGSLAERARAIGLDRHVRVGRTHLRAGDAGQESILASALEAVLGAVFLDGGLEAVRDLVRRIFADAFEAGAPVVPRDPKTRFQEWAHAQRQLTPRYRTIADSGVDEAEDRFDVQVELAGEVWGSGRGRTKRAAERLAAEKALRRAMEEGGD